VDRIAAIRKLQDLSDAYTRLKEKAKQEGKEIGDLLDTLPDTRTNRLFDTLETVEEVMKEWGYHLLMAAETVEPCTAGITYAYVISIPGADGGYDKPSHDSMGRIYQYHQPERVAAGEECDHCLFDDFSVAKAALTLRAKQGSVSKVFPVICFTSREPRTTDPG
jgi:predicted Zn-ribbon and HTH transcriptional regulator